MEQIVNDLRLTTDILLCTPNFSILTAILQHALEKGLMIECVRISNQTEVSPCSSDCHIATSDFLQKPILPYRTFQS